MVSREHRVLHAAEDEEHQREVASDSLHTETQTVQANRPVPGEQPQLQIGLSDLNVLIEKLKKEENGFDLADLADEQKNGEQNGELNDEAGKKRKNESATKKEKKRVKFKDEIDDLPISKATGRRADERMNVEETDEKSKLRTR